jgi:hypothetical protein
MLSGTIALPQQSLASHLGHSCTPRLRQRDLLLEGKQQLVAGFHLAALKHERGDGVQLFVHCRHNHGTFQSFDVFESEERESCTENFVCCLPL